MPAIQLWGVHSTKEECAGGGLGVKTASRKWNFPLCAKGKRHCVSDAKMESYRKLFPQGRKRELIFKPDAIPFARQWRSCKQARMEANSLSGENSGTKLPACVARGMEVLGLGVISSHLFFLSLSVAKHLPHALLRA
jgi:hypothetical protein